MNIGNDVQCVYMKVFRDLTASIGSGVCWVVLATFVNLLSLFGFAAVLGKDFGGKDEVLRSFGAAGITAVLTMLAVILLFRNGMKLQAISISVIAALLGGYYLLVIFSFGAEYLF